MYYTVTDHNDWTIVAAGSLPDLDRIMTKRDRYWFVDKPYRVWQVDEFGVRTLCMI